MDGNYGAALEQSQRAAQLAPDLATADILISHLYRSQAHNADSEAALARARSLSANNPHVVAMLACAYAKAGRREESARLFHELEQMAKRRYVSPYDLANVSFTLGDEEHAVTLFEEAFRERSVGMIFLRRDKECTRSPKLLNLIGRIRAS
jgi:tetratricopeptide (TPR) repeat protein